MKKRNKMHPYRSSTLIWKALIACHLHNCKTPLRTIECLNGMLQMTINAILLQNPPKLERQSYYTFPRLTKHAKRSLPYFQDFSNIEKRIERNNEILVMELMPWRDWKMKNKKHFCIAWCLTEKPESRIRKKLWLSSTKRNRSYDSFLIKCFL